jgi:hypothetical protein
MLGSSSLCSSLKPPNISYLFGPNILLSALFSNTLGLCSSLNVRDKISRPYSTTSIRGSSVGIATGYGLDDRRSEFESR